MCYVEINFIGDIVLPKRYQLDNLQNYLTKDSINIGNLESPILQSPIDLKRYNLKKKKKKKKIKKKKITLFSLEESANFLKDLNIKAVSLANNHIFDFGKKGFEETIDILKHYGIKWFGAGKDLKSSLKPLIFKDKGMKIGILGMGWDIIECINSSENSYGVPSLNSRNIEYIKNLKKFTDFLIVYVHWDYEFERYPLPFQRKLAHKMIDIGANIVIGSHPHRIQGIEKYHNGIIVYSLGNFLIPQKKYLKRGPILIYPKISNITFILNLKITSNNIIEYKVIPFYNKSTRLKRLTNDSLFFKIFNKLSEPLDLDDSQYKRFFKKNRYNKLLPVLTDFEFINKQILLLYLIRNFFFNILIIIKSRIKI